MWECFLYFLYHGILCICQTEITVFENLCREFRVFLLIAVKDISILCCFTFPVPSFARETANGNYCSICIFSRFIQKFIRKLRLNCHTRYCTICVLFLNVFLIIFRKFIENFYFFLILFNLHALIKIADVFYSYIAASSAAFYVVYSTLTKECDLRPFPDRKCVFLVFQKNHSLSCCHSGKCNVLFTSCNSSSIFSQRKHRLEKTSLPFCHYFNPPLISLVKQIK